MASKEGNSNRLPFNDNDAGDKDSQANIGSHYWRPQRRMILLSLPTMLERFKSTH